MMHADRLRHARVALEGLSVGDAFGAHLELRRYAELKKMVDEGWLPKAPWHYTDDTNMALSIYQILREYGEIDQDQLAASFAKRFTSKRGYGAGASRLLKSIQAGESWRTITPMMFSGTGSYGNGAAMRIPPLGAYFADDLATCVENAHLSSEVTHSHPEGIAGGIAVAVATAVVVRADGDLEKARTDFYSTIIEHTPISEVRSKISRVGTMRTTDPIHIAQMVGNGSGISAQDTVPFVLWSAFTFMDNYEQAMWQTASVGGDVDTTCAMVGGIVACLRGMASIPQEWRNNREKLPQWSLGEN